MSPNLDSVQSSAASPAQPFRIAPARDELWRTVQTQTADRFEMLDELGRGDGGSVAYLARPRHGRRPGELVVLNLDRVPADQATTVGDHGDQFALSIVRALGPPVPALESTCQACGARITDWRRRCPRCAADVSGVAEASGTGTSRAELLAAVMRETRDKYDVLGAMPRAEGGGPVYFARERGSGRLAALRYFGPTPAPTPDATPAPAAATKVCPQCETQYGDDVQFCSRDGTALRPLRSDADLVGQIIADKYRVLEKLGEGGMGQVFLAEHVKMGMHCAVKVMGRAFLHDVEAVGRFQRGATNAARISHANVAAVYDYGETRDGLVYLVMEFAKGEPLTKLVEQEGPFAVRRAAGIVGQVADAITAAHDLQIVHRDLKPDNIMVGRSRDGSDSVKVVDFGIAKAVGRSSQVLTQFGQVIGTPEYMSPEQLGPKELDGRSDIYSLGIVTFYMLTGTTPFVGQTWQDVMVARLSQRPRTLAEARPDAQWPAGLQAVVDRALARDRDERYQTAEEFARDLAAVARLRRRSTGPTPPINWWQQWRSALAAAVPRPVLLAGTATLALGAVVAAGAAVLHRTVAAVDVAPDTATVAAGRTVRLAATVRAADRRSLDGQTIVWRSLNPSVATVSDAGEVTGVFPGTAVVTAEGRGKRGEARVSVTAASLKISPASPPRLRPAQRVELSATARDASGKVLRDVPVTWSSSNRAVVTLGAATGAANTVTGTGAGTATISAVGGGQTGTAVVTVAPPSVSNSPRSPSPPPTTTVCDARAALNQLQALTDPSSSNANGAQLALRRWRAGQLACMTTRADSAEALYYFGLALLRTERVQEACRMLASASAKARGTAYARAIDTLLTDPEVGCPRRAGRGTPY